MFQIIYIFPGEDDFSSDVNFFSREQISRLGIEPVQTIGFCVSTANWETYSVLTEGGNWITVGDDDIEIVRDASSYEVAEFLADSLNVPLVGLEPTLKRF